MKISDKTITILKHMSMINPSICVKQGSVLTSYAESRATLARANVAEVFENEFAIFDLPRFLGVLSLFKDPEISFGNKSMTITSDPNNGGSVEYFYTDPSTVLTEERVPSLKMLESFKIEANILQGIMKAMNVLQVPYIQFVGDGNQISINAVDPAKMGTNSYHLVIGKTEKKFKVALKAELLKLYPDFYEVGISTNGFVEMKGNTIQYWLSPDKKYTTI